MYTAADLLGHCTKRGFGQRVAIVEGQRRVRYDELLTLALGYGGRFKEAGLKKGDRVAIYLPRSVEAVACLFGTLFTGCVAVVLSEVLRSRQVSHILKHCEASVLITDSRHLLTVPDLGIEKNRIINLDTVQPVQEQWSPVSTIDADLALIIYTSGSTGLPKGIMVSHGNLLSGAKIVADYLRITEDDTVISLLPFSFDYGLNQLLTVLLAGGTLVIQRSLAPPDICRTLQRERVTGMAGIPTLWLQLIERGSPFLKTSFPRLRYLTNSGGRLPESVVRLFRKAHPHVNIYLMYGLTEAFRSTYLPPDQVDERPTSIGRPIPNVEILVMNERGGLCEVGEVGELVHRGGTVTMGYWRDPDSTAKVFQQHPLKGQGKEGAETVVFSGDLVRRDADGYLYFVGRRDQLMKSKGFRVSPEEIEQWVFESDLVSGVVAFGVPGKDDESEIVLAVVPKDAETFRDAMLSEFCKKQMPGYMRPRAVWVLERFPLTSTGKPDRVALQKTYVEQPARS